jgi:hypothetical protein
MKQKRPRYFTPHYITHGILTIHSFFLPPPNHLICMLHYYYPIYYIRYFTAGWSQASSQNSENLAQSAFQFSQSQSLGLAGYYQSEKQNAQSMKLAFLQDCKNREMAWRVTVRESLRDELLNQFNQYNILILVDTIALGFVFSNVNPDGALRKFIFMKSSQT